MNLVVLFALAVAGAQGSSYAPAVRVDYVQSALAAVRGARAESLEQAYNYLSAMERSACAAGAEWRRVDCLISAARRHCGGRPPAEARSCTLYADVIVSNLLAEKHLVSTQQRYAMMRQKDYRRALKIYVRRLQGTLATDFKLATRTAGAALPGDIDRYCRTTADVSHLSWQSCVAALVWFIGRQP
jgi:hypothetical protein